MNENLQVNPFFAAMLDHIPDLEKSCISKQWILCIPQAVALPEPHRISLRLLKMHVLIPVAGQLNEFTTLASDVRVTKQNAGKDLLVIEQNSERTIPILYRETIYCGIRAEEAYSAFCVARPLGGGGQAPTFEDGTEVFINERPTAEWEEIFFTRAKSNRAWEEARAELSQLERRITEMEDPLQVMPGPRKEPRAYTEMRIFGEKLSRGTAASSEWFEAATTNPKYMSILQTAYESCAARATHGIVFAALSMKNSAAEDDVQMRLHDLRQLILIAKIPDDKSGLTAAFLARFNESKRSSAAFQASVNALQAINEQTTPLEKLWCLRDAVRALKDVPNHTNMDDALPLFLLALLSAAPGLLLANLAFMADFAPRLWVKSVGELAYHLTVFSGAVTVIQEHVPTIQGESDFFLRNLILPGGSGLGLTWMARNGTQPSQSAAAIPQAQPSLFKIFESCAPQSRN